MTKKRIRIDVEDSDGATYDIKVEGNVTREKVLKIFEMLELMNIEAEDANTIPSTVGSIFISSNISKILSTFSLVTLPSTLISYVAPSESSTSIRIRFFVHH